MEINIDTKQYRIKPENEWTVINNRVANNVEDLSLEEIIERVGNKGYAFTRARLYGGRQEENFGRQIFLVLDFDDGMEDAEFRSRCKKYQVPYLFTYRTLSWKKNDNRFRAVFLLDEWIENKKVAKMANVILRGLFPESDKSCIDLNLPWREKSNRHRHGSTGNCHRACTVTGRILQRYKEEQLCP